MIAVSCTGQQQQFSALKRKGSQTTCLIFTKKSDEAKKNSVYDQEFYAIIKALKWKHYLLHKEICHIHSS